MALQSLPSQKGVRSWMGTDFLLQCALFREERDSGCERRQSLFQKCSHESNAATS